MTRLIPVMVLSLTIVAGASATAYATDVGSSRTFGLGFQVGDPTAIIGKVYVGGDNAIDFGVGFGGWGYGRCRDRQGRWYYDCGGYGNDLSLHGDFLWQDTLVRSQVKLDWHLGGGARIIFWDTWDDTYVALIGRMPIGLDLTFNRPDFLEVFFEIVPGIQIIPRPWFDIDFALGVRFYF
jgi:hypothetical protein